MIAQSLSGAADQRRSARSGAARPGLAWPAYVWDDVRKVVLTRQVVQNNMRS